MWIFSWKAIKSFSFKIFKIHIKAFFWFRKYCNFKNKIEIITKSMCFNNRMKKNQLILQIVFIINCYIPLFHTNGVFKLLILKGFFVKLLRYIWAFIQTVILHIKTVIQLYKLTYYFFCFNIIKKEQVPNNYFKLCP